MMPNISAGVVAHRTFPSGDPVFAPKFVERGLELQRLEKLSWPRNLFGDYASIAELMAEAAEPSSQYGDTADRVCPCGCGREHKHSVSQTLGNPYGRGFDVIYFRSNPCKSKWNRERIGREVCGV